jgi:phage-related protein
MDILVLISSAVSALSTLVIAFLVFQVQKSLHTNKTQQEKLLRFLEEANEISKDIKRIASEETIQHNAASANIKIQFENLIRENQNIKKSLQDFLQNNGNINQNIFQLVQEIQKVENFLDELLQSNGKSNHNLINLTQETQNIKNNLNDLLQATIKDNKNLYNLLFGNTNMQLEKLQLTVDELKALKVSLEESIRF